MSGRLLRATFCLGCVLWLGHSSHASASGINSASAPASSPISWIDDKQHAAKPYALIFGTVYGPDQHPVAGVVVKIRRASNKKPTWEGRSDSRGEFAQRLPAGAADYVVWAQLNGRQASQKKEVTVHMENDERRDISIHLAQ